MQGLVIPDKLANALLTAFDGGSIIAVSTGVAKAFEWFDKGLNQEGREALGRLLSNEPPNEKISSWALIFPSMIDRYSVAAVCHSAFFLDHVLLHLLP